MQRSESIINLAAALSKAQAVMTGAMKDSQNPHFKSSYADLSSVWDACRKPLTDNGLSVVQLPAYTERGTVEIETILVHESGEYIGGSIEIPVSKVDAQGLGSAITYGRRYSLAAVVGIAPEEDDGESAVGRGQGFKQKQTGTATPAKQTDISGASQGGSQPKAEKTPPTSNTEPDPKAAEYHDRIRACLRQIFSEDKGAALTYVETESAWIDKTTGEVKAAGVKDYRKLSEGRAKVLCHKLEAEVKKRQTAQPAQAEPQGAVCDTCGQELMADGMCPSCPF
jgi:hypothetical protein